MHWAGGLEYKPNVGRGGQTRTADLLVPNQAPYRWATPRGLVRIYIKKARPSSFTASSGELTLNDPPGTPGESRTLVSGSGGRHSIH